MRLYDFFLQIIEANTDDFKISEIANVRWSLMKAVELKQYLELYERNGMFAGFVTWEVRPNGEMIDIGINNLVVLKRARGTYSLLRITKMLRKKYPNIAAFVWQSRKRNRLIEFKQRGTYANIQENLQPTR